jgi:hypothetical protein
MAKPPVSPPPLDVRNIDHPFLTNWYQAIQAPAGVVAAPATSGAKGVPGQIAFDQNFVYVAVGVNQWKRIALVAF